MTYVARATGVDDPTSVDDGTSVDNATSVDDATVVDENLVTARYPDDLPTWLSSIRKVVKSTQ